jgi:hypothetical protein
LTPSYQQNPSAQWNHRNNNSTATVGQFSSNGHHQIHHPSPHFISSATVGSNSIEVVAIKTPHRQQNEIPETSI